MKYMLLSMAALAAAFGLSFLIAWRVRRKMKKKIALGWHIAICVGAGCLVLFAAAAVYVNIHYAAQDEALAVLSEKGEVTVTEENGGYFIDGKGERTALAFYPGAKVDAEAYLPLMKRLAEGGTDCFLVKPPLRLAMLDSNAAQRFFAAHDYAHRLVGGHSMGGVAAASFAASHADEIDGAVLLAAYPNSTLSNDTFLLTVCGTNDKVLDRAAYDAAKKNFPSDATEVIVKGGNHAGFGNYGAQSGDGEADVTRDEQQKQTAEAIFQAEHAHGIG